jgi:hypothetical protein
MATMAIIFEPSPPTKGTRASAAHQVAALGTCDDRVATNEDHE